MATFIFTFGVRYNDPKDAHPADKRITGQTFIKVEAETEFEARNKMFGALDNNNNWAFVYEDDQETQDMIARHGLVELPFEQIGKRPL